MTLKIVRRLICDWCGTEVKASKYMNGLDMCMTCVENNNNNNNNHMVCAV